MQYLNIAKLQKKADQLDKTIQKIEAQPEVDYVLVQLWKMRWHALNDIIECFDKEAKTKTK